MATAPFYGWGLDRDGTLVVMRLKSKREADLHKNMARSPMGGYRRWGSGKAPQGMTEDEIVAQLKEQTGARRVRVNDADLSAGVFQGLVASDLRSQALRIAAELPKGDETRRKLLAAVQRSATDIKVTDFEFASGQEPRHDDYDDDFVTLVTVTFVVKGKALARLLGKQQRVLEQYLEKLGEHQAVRAIESGDRGAYEVLKVVEPVIKHEVKQYVWSEFDDRETNEMSVDLAGDQDFASAKIDPRRQQITFEMEFDVLGAWDWLD